MSGKSLSLKECYAILDTPEGSGIDEIKRAYRKRAFELHPDLNPGDGASRQFQQLNEAYVVLINLLNSKPKGGFFQRKAAQTDASSAKAGRQAYAEQARQDKERQEQERKERREQQEAERRERQEAERRAREHQEKQDKEKREAERRERLRSEIERQEAERLARKAKAKEEKEKQARAREEAARQQEENAGRQARPENHRRTYAKPGQAAASGATGNGFSTQPGSASAQGSGHGEASWNTGTGSYSASGSQDDVSREALLNDLLNDPFARRVYEDIYSEVQNRKTGSSETTKITPEPVRSPGKDQGITLGKALKGWMRGQIDETQELFFPAASLYPGAKFRLKIRPGLSGEPRTIEVTLPPDFTVGKAIRLKGMGKKLGKWQGDLYLTFQIKS